MKYINTLKMIADIGTKLLERKQFVFLRDLMNGYALVAASGNHMDPLPVMCMKRKDLVGDVYLDESRTLESMMDDTERIWSEHAAYCDCDGDFDECVDNPDNNKSKI